MTYAMLLDVFFSLICETEVDNHLYFQALKSRTAEILRSWRSRSFKLAEEYCGSPLISTDWMSLFGHCSYLGHPCEEDNELLPLRVQTLVA